MNWFEGDFRKRLLAFFLNMIILIDKLWWNQIIIHVRFIPKYALLIKKNTQLNNFEFNVFVYFYEAFVKPHFTSFICRHWSRFCHFPHCKLGASWSGFPVPLLAVIASFWHTPDLGRNRIPFLPSIAEYSTSAVCSLQYCWSNLGNKRWRKNFINVNTTNQKKTIFVSQ